MDALRPALKEQFHAGLAMLDECVAVCPDDLWRAGEHPRASWRIAFHAAFFTQIGLGQDEAAYRSWIGHREDVGDQLDPAFMEPYELPEEVPPYDPGQIRGYLAHLRGQVDPMIDALDLERADSGFSWYDDMGKLSHVLDPASSPRPHRPTLRTPDDSGDRHRVGRPLLGQKVRSAITGLRAL